MPRVRLPRSRSASLLSDERLRRARPQQRTSPLTQDRAISSYGPVEHQQSRTRSLARLRWAERRPRYFESQSASERCHARRASVTRRARHARRPGPTRCTRRWEGTRSRVDGYGPALVRSAETGRCCGASSAARTNSPAVDGRDGNGRTALMLATLQGQAQVVDIVAVCRI